MILEVKQKTLQKKACKLHQQKVVGNQAIRKCKTLTAKYTIIT
jgi:hypothetical protein